jgi:hypothetical protein
MQPFAENSQTKGGYSLPNAQHQLRRAAPSAACCCSATVHEEQHPTRSRSDRRRRWWTPPTHLTSPSVGWWSDALLRRTVRTRRWRR